MRKTNHFFKAMAALLAALLLAKLLRDRSSSRSEDADSDVQKARHRQQKEARLVEGEESREREHYVGDIDSDN